ncbi:MAG: hypothetical protein HY822_16245, partial [Acidobacteria bacterium]|nr:hypothetical protein [Acidobacteriota bacterium]
MVWNYRVCLAVAVVWAGLPGAPPPEPVTAEAAAILDRYVEASGGQAAHARIR